jgi:TRAP-type C4-dicarboxylate transport system, small permease component
MSTIARFSGRAASALEWLLRIIAISVLVVLVCTVFFQVARRTLTGKSIVEIEEFSIVMAAWLAFLTIPYAVRRKVHVRIEVFIEKLPFTAKNVLELTLHVAILAATVLVAYYGYRLAMRKVMVPMTVLPVHQGVWFISFPIGMAIASFFMLDNVVQTLHRFQTRESYLPVDPLAEAGVTDLTVDDLLADRDIDAHPKTDGKEN